ncbi:MAG TPA: hypothetical protein DCQ51_12915 [Planktothrix sp. UBA8407]|jgi:Protein of unknown function (DUF1822).|nr:hypothetical protein [Planktothrix sp. UBA8407]HBK23759.1 hypothetical protein [Planktothrix sp. UBA10369]
MKLMDISQELPIINPEQIKPGQIWEVRRQVFSPLEFTPEEKQHFYSPAIFDFLNGNTPPRYVIIVTEPELEIDETPEWQIILVMLLSVKTDYLSLTNLLIPTTISGLKQDVIVETCNVIKMLTCNLLRPVGKRLSRKIYDLLLDVGDFEQGFIEKAPSLEEILALGLNKGTTNHPEFHQQELDWKTVLEVPVAVYYLYVKAVLTLDETLLLEQLKAKVTIQPVPLSQWFQEVIQTGWQTFEEVFGIFSTTPALEGWRGKSNPDFPGGEVEITQIETLVKQIQTTEDDDILWNTVATLRQLQPHHSALGVRKVKSINIQETTLVLTMNLISRVKEEVRILLEVYSIDNSPLPKDLKVMILDDKKDIVLEDTAENEIVSIALQGLIGEKFSVKITTKDDFILEDFLI